MPDNSNSRHVTVDILDYFKSKLIDSFDYVNANELSTKISLPNQDDKTSENNIWIDDTDTVPSIIYEVNGVQYKLTGTPINNP